MCIGANSFLKAPIGTVTTVGIGGMGLDILTE